MRFRLNNFRALQVVFLLAASTGSAICGANELTNIVPSGQVKTCVLANAVGAHVRVWLSLEDPRFDTQWHPLTGLLFLSKSGKPIVRIDIESVLGENFFRIN